MDFIILLPSRAIQTIVPIKFMWGEPEKIGYAYVCHKVYYGLKIASKVIFISKEDCPPI